MPTMIQDPSNVKTSEEHVQPCLQESEPWYSRYTFLWSHKLISKGSQQTLRYEDLYNIREDEKTKFSHENFAEIINRNQNQSSQEPSQSLRSSIWQLALPTLKRATILTLIIQILNMCNPILMKQLLEFFDTPGTSIPEGLTIVFAFSSVLLIKVFFQQHKNHLFSSNWMKIRGSLITLIYQKVNRLSPVSRLYADNGVVMNHIHSDIGSLIGFGNFLPEILVCPFLFFGTMWLLIREVGWIALVSLVFFGFLILIQKRNQKIWTSNGKKSRQLGDRKSTAINQFFGGIKIIKYYGWEDIVSRTIFKIAEEQIEINRSNDKTGFFNHAINSITSLLASLCVLALYSFLNDGMEDFTIAKVYSVIMLFGMVGHPLNCMVYVAESYTNAKISIERIQHFLNYQERDTQGYEQTLGVGELRVEHCEFTWEDNSVKQHFEQGTKLKELKDKTTQEEKQKAEKSKQQKKACKSTFIQDLNIRKGELISISGKVGCGKSTLLHGLIGECRKVKGKVNLKGKVAFVSQTTWLRNDTLRNNVLFESEFEEERYNRAIKLSQLEEDIEILSEGDNSLIGQKGLTLSGGQKQRLSIARALYSDADIYLFDDCLSALDPYVGSKVFQKCIKGWLKEQGKTVILVTSSEHFASHCDRMLQMKDGQIIRTTSRKQLEKLQKDESNTGSQKSTKTEDIFQRKLDSSQQDKHSRKSSTSVEDENEVKSIVLIDGSSDSQLEQDLGQVNIKPVTEQNVLLLEELKKQQKLQEQHAISKKKLAKNLQKEEEKRIKQQKKRIQMDKQLSFAFYLRFFKSFDMKKMGIMCMLLALNQIVHYLEYWWLGEWVQDSLKLSNMTYILGYILIVAMVGIIIITRGWTFFEFKCTIRKHIQSRLIDKLLHTTSSWFDTTPSSQIITRVTSDQDSINHSLTFSIHVIIEAFFRVCIMICVLWMASPYYIVVFFVIGLAFYPLLQMYKRSALQLRKLQDECHSPLSTHIQQTLQGSISIKCFDKSPQFTELLNKKHDRFLIIIKNIHTSDRWMDIVNSFMASGIVILCVYIAMWSRYRGDEVNVKLIGLSFVKIIEMVGYINWIQRMLIEFRKNMNAVQRIYKYIDQNPQEADFDHPQPKSHQWPTSGCVKAQNVSFRYSEQLPMVIKNISFDVDSHAKIGIVGRTGSGKSTMTLGLLRMLELANNSDGLKGSVRIDSEDLSEIGLHHLRHNITIIPQDPVLFTGTMKFNIDPFDAYSDLQVSECLKKCHIWDSLDENPDKETDIQKKVYSKVQKGGTNFSLGQKQLVCMARALIKRPKVLLMDEATASIDEATDQLVQEMIRTEFKATTVITIAHRLNTIVSYDKILVLDKGEIAEYEKPFTLLNDDKSFLSKIVSKVGGRYKKELIKMAEKSQRKRDQMVQQN